MTWRDNVVRLSRIPGPTNNRLDKTANCLLESAGFVQREASGFFSLLPLGQRVLDNIVRIIEHELDTLGASKLTLPSLQPATLWNKSGRGSLLGEELYRINDDMVLAPTFEEQICHSVAKQLRSHKQLPLRLYQTGPKWRHERRPRGGMARLREFVMNDLYTFDRGLEDAESTFSKVLASYHRIFQRLNLPAMAVQASNGIMGGLKSVEFHLLSPELGQDDVAFCGHCSQAFNAEVLGSSTLSCPECHHDLTKHQGLELAHCFLLGTHYSQLFDVAYVDQHNQRQLAQMGCYGVGVARLMAALANHHADEHGLKWPGALAPFSMNIISKSNLMEDPRLQLLFANFPAGSILWDDREDLSIGRRIRDSRLMGIPRTVVIGNAWKERQLLELYDRRGPRGLFREAAGLFTAGQLD